MPIISRTSSHVWAGDAYSGRHPQHHGWHRDRRATIRNGIRRLSPHRRSSLSSASPGRCGQVQKQVLGGAIRRDFLQIVTPAGLKSAIDRGTRRQPYFSKAVGVSYPLAENCGSRIFIGQPMSRRSNRTGKPANAQYR